MNTTENRPPKVGDVYRNGDRKATVTKIHEGTVWYVFERDGTPAFLNHMNQLEFENLAARTIANGGTFTPAP
jgi:hypothetical protein